MNKDNTLDLRENVVAGIVGAFLFSLAGAAIYFVLHLIGYIASISGLVGAVCAVKGYTVFSKKESKKGIVIATVVSLLVIVIAWYFCLAYDVYDAYKIGFETGETDFYFTFIESLRVAPLFLEEPEISKAYFGDLALGLFFCLIGCGSYVVNKLKNTNKKNVTQPRVTSTEQSEENIEESHVEF